jgi:thymidine kinase
MINIIKKMFEASPEKSTIVLKETCSDCGRETVIEIIPTSSGFGLQGGALVKGSSEAYLMRCLDCHSKTKR